MTKRITHTLILRLLTVVTLMLCTTLSYSQTQPTEELYEFDMKYTGSSTQVSGTYRYVLLHLVELMEKNPDWTLHVRGHVCCGPDEKLSHKRAKKVYQFLIKSGLSKSRLSYKGYSDTKPLIFPEKTEGDATKNRRVDFLIKKPSKTN